ncbi:MAG: M4 family metallopeptidase [Kofleriaceae bacterium]|nr:M4 family metallopeptidase [Myxococcales bacterium]MCB9563724.1 M4 family metallopeptidase [Kofleriaceae bacterium]MCB9565552.1 M4 family metallopeptidase [Kofleriaceae bacterium]MCB9575123.1 M4 family metallopeptidase [Kofleriaceae bacterium]MCB9575316.1 M4 family metallopeptidase [Kofleriaceae bacterium]
MRTRWTSTFATSLLLAISACAVDGEPEDLNPAPTGDVATERAIAVAQTQLPGVLSLGAADDVAPLSVVHDGRGQAHVRFQQEHQGLPVFMGQAIAHVDIATSKLATITDARMAVSDVDVDPTVRIEDAIVTTSAVAGARDGVASADLMIYVAPDGTSHLVWHVELVRDDGDPVDRVALVDAHDGSVIFTYDNLQTGKGSKGRPGGGGGGGGGGSTAAVGIGHALYAGTVSVGTDYDGSSTYTLRDLTRGAFYTIDMKGRQSGGTVYTDSDNVWGDGSASSSATVAVDAHYGQAMTFDYYQNVHGRSGIDGAGNAGYSRVHYGRRYNNAYWSDSCFCMTYGDGDGSVLSPLASLDVAGHEMTHGVTSRTAGLVYSGESGGLNEAMSDIFGTAVEFYANNPAEPGDWLIGAQVYTPNKAGDALRYMDHPTRDGASIDHYSNYSSGLDVHYSSGLANNAFYLLAQGGTNDTSGQSVTGIGRTKAEQIFYRALTVYMTPGTTFAGARAATLSAAADLYGASSAERNAVATAWSACGVN